LFHLCASGPGCSHRYGVFGRCTPPGAHPCGWPGITGLRRLSKQGTGGSRRTLPFDHAVFRRESFTRVQPLQLGFRHRCRPPAPFGWESRLNTATRSDVPCRPHGATPRLPPLGAARLRTPERTRTRRPSRPGLLPHEPVKARELAAQDAFDWLDPNLSTRIGYPSSKLFASFQSSCDTLSHALGSPACHGDGSPSNATLLRASDTEAPSTCRREDASHQSLQPTCCHEHPANPASLEQSALASPTTGSAAALPSVPSYRLPSSLLPGGADDSRRIRRPRVVAQLAPRAPAVTLTIRAPPAGAPPTGAC
jgi:hypothetical protein